MGNSNSSNNSDNKNGEYWENGVLYDREYTPKIHQERKVHYNACVACGGSPDYMPSNNGRYE